VNCPPNRIAVCWGDSSSNGMSAFSRTRRSRWIVVRLFCRSTSK
jgi:hypothetical protein